MKIKTGILVDPMGHSFGAVTPAMEIKEHVKLFKELLRPNEIAPYTLKTAYSIKPGTNLILFDYGGMLPGSGDLIAGEARALLKWAQDHPSSLAVVVSAFTYRNYIRYELEELGLSLHNVVHRDSLLEDPIPLWFRLGDKISKTHAIAGLTPTGGCLPDIQFFKPAKGFASWFESAFHRDKVYEAGSGMGHAAKALSDAGVRITAIDANSRPGAVFKTEQEDATTFDYWDGSVVLICRPCHGPFCEAVIHRAIFRRARAIVYVGLNKNLDGDLGYFRPFFTLMKDRVGQDGEGAWGWLPEWNQDPPRKATKKK